MAQVVFLLLLVANLVYFIWSAGYLGGGSEGREPERLAAQIQPERMEIAVRTAASDTGKTEASEAKPAGDAAPVAEAAAPTPANGDASRATETVCRRVGPIPRAEADRLAASLREKGVTVTEVGAAEDGNNYWVHIPAAEASSKLVGELKQAGFTDFFIASEGPNKGAISLGLFHREQAAKDLQQRLVKKGIKPVKIDVRPRRAEKIALDLRGPADPIDKTLADHKHRAAACPAQ